MTPVTRRERSRQQDTRDDGAHRQRSFNLAPLQDANVAFRAFAQVFPLDRMPRVKALTPCSKDRKGEGSSDRTASG